MLTKPSPSAIGRIAIAVGIVELIGLVFIAIFYGFIESFGGPFGTLNDLCVALGGILSGALVWTLYSTQRLGGRLAVGSGIVGALLAPLGSALVITNVTGWFLAGLVTTFGYALIGLWLLTVNRSSRSLTTVPRGLARFGMLAGGVMAVGLLVAPGILARIDAPEVAPWFVQAGLYLGGLAWNILYPIWCIWFGRLLVSKKLLLQASAPAASEGD